MGKWGGRYISSGPRVLLYPATGNLCIAAQVQEGRVLREFSYIKKRWVPSLVHEQGPAESRHRERGGTCAGRHGHHRELHRRRHGENRTEYCGGDRGTVLRCDGFQGRRLRLVHEQTRKRAQADHVPRSPRGSKRSGFYKALSTAGKASKAWIPIHFPIDIPYSSSWTTHCGKARPGSSRLTSPGRRASFGPPTC